MSIFLGKNKDKGKFLWYNNRKMQFIYHLVVALQYISCKAGSVVGWPAMVVVGFMEKENGMPKKRQEKRQEKRESIREFARQNKGLVAVYVVLRLLVLLVMVTQIFNRDYFNVFLCLLTLVLFTIPSIVEHRLHIDVPDTLEVIILLFIFAAEILGEIRAYYLQFPYWDTMLHTISGFLMAAIGFSLIDILNRSERVALNLAPVFVGLFAFCFSMTVGVMWEFFEFGMDRYFGMDMQKDTVVSHVTSVELNPEGKNVPVTVPVESLVVNGEDWDLGGYLDIGIIDTMKDLFVNFIGAVVFSIIGVFYIKGRGKGSFKGRGKGSFARRFIPTMKKHQEPLSGRKEN